MVKKPTSITLTGILKHHPKGHSFFFPDMNHAGNLSSGIDFKVYSRLIVSRQHILNALDGDRVEVTVIQSSPDKRFSNQSHSKGKRQDEMHAAVKQVITRRSGKIVGVFYKKNNRQFVESEESSLPFGIAQIMGDHTAQEGQMVVVDLSEWVDKNKEPVGKIIEVLGWPGNPSVGIQSVIHRYGLRTSFPQEVMDEAMQIAESIPEDEMKRRKDWRKHLVITIDPADAKDHDDAIWLEKTDFGWRLAVHIADVSFYIKPNQAMDKEAAERGNSTYLVDRVLPMLPTALSNGICSLKPNVDRLTKCALIDISHRGDILNTIFIDAVIHSRAKLSYEQAQAILDGKAAPPDSEEGLVPMIQEAWKMASVLRKRRFERGALDLEMSEVKIYLDDQGCADQVLPVVHSESHQLIEECMLAANDAVANALKNSQRPAIYRIHEDPDPSRLMDYTEIAIQHGYRPGDLTNRKHIQRLLDQAKDSPEEHVIKLGLLKSLKRAAYSVEPIGHYGLAKGDYCHFTSPIRRYADLVVHRALQPLLQNPPKPIDKNPPQQELTQLAQHCSETERVSAEAEGETKQIKLFEYLQRILEKQEPVVMPGLVTEARPMGLMVEIPHLGIRGVVKREDLPLGRWRFSDYRHEWASDEGLSFQAGKPVHLILKSIDVEKRFVDFSIHGFDSEDRGAPKSSKYNMPKRGGSAAKGSYASASKRSGPISSKRNEAKKTKPTASSKGFAKKSSSASSKGAPYPPKGTPKRKRK